LSNPSKAVAKDYGVLQLLGYAKRHTIYISDTGTVLKIDTAVNPKPSAEDMASTLGELGVAKR